MKVMLLATKNITAYKKLQNKLTIAPLENIRMFPITTKQEIRENKADYVNYDEDEFSVIFTSGSTGTPMAIEVSKDALKKNYAFFWRFLSQLNITREDKNITFAGRKIISDNQKEPPYWRFNYFMNNALFSSYHISEETIPHYIIGMEKFNPQYIDSYPSAIYQISEYINRKGICTSLCLKAIVTSSETLLPYQRKSIEQAFRCKVYDQYGSAEMCAFASQCEHGTYHIDPEYCYLEVVNEEGEVTDKGEVGDIICTGFINKRMPLIRYSIGDRGSIAESHCKCGRKGQTLTSLEGRKDDFILTPDGRKVGRLDPIYKGLTGIKESQIVQTSIDEIVVYLVRTPLHTSSCDRKLTEELNSRLGHSINVKIKHVTKLEKTSSGKFRAVVSLLESH